MAKDEVKYWILYTSKTSNLRFIFRELSFNQKSNLVAQNPG